MLMKLRALALASALLIGACTEPQQEIGGLPGLWMESGGSPAGRQLTLGVNGQFWSYFPFTGGGGSYITGTWSASGDRLTFATETRREYSATGAPGPLETYVNKQFFDQATYSLTSDGSTLTITYLTYPFDGPVTTVMVLERLRPID